MGMDTVFCSIILSLMIHSMVNEWVPETNLSNGLLVLSTNDMFRLFPFSIVLML